MIKAGKWRGRMLGVLVPLLLLIGLATRLSALALLGMTLVIQVFVYPGAYATHGTWAAVLLILMAIVVVALLRSHAEILRKLDALGQGAAGAAPDLADPNAGPRREGVVAAPDIAGADLDLKVGGLPVEEHVCQYRESDLAFLHRWLDREGLTYWFDHEGDAVRGAAQQRCDHGA